MAERTVHIRYLISIALLFLCACSGLSVREESAVKITEDVYIYPDTFLDTSNVILNVQCLYEQGIEKMFLGDSATASELLVQAALILQIHQTRNLSNIYDVRRFEVLKDNLISLGYLDSVSNKVRLPLLIKYKTRFIDVEDLYYSIANDTSEIVDFREGHLPVVINSFVKDKIRYFEKNQYLLQNIFNKLYKYREIYLSIIEEYDLPPELLYVAVIESGLEPFSVSYRNAVGPWQIMKPTGIELGLKINRWIDERFDPVKSTHKAAIYLKQLYDRFEDWHLAMAAYNCGPSRLRNVIEREGTKNFWALTSLPTETQNYVYKIMAFSIIALEPEKFGIEIPASTGWQFAIQVIYESRDLTSIAASYDISVRMLRRLNPELLTSKIPENLVPYKLRVPVLF